MASIVLQDCSAAGHGSGADHRQQVDLREWVDHWLTVGCAFFAQTVSYGLGVKLQVPNLPRGSKLSSLDSGTRRRKGIQQVSFFRADFLRQREPFAKQ